MSTALSATLLAWLLTYAIHSTVLLGAVWAITRSRRISPVAIDLLWKVALIGGIVTASIQQRLDMRPSATLTLPQLSARPLTQRSADNPRNVGISPGQSATVQRIDEPVGVSSASESPVPDPAPIVASRVGAPTIAVTLWAMVALMLALVYAARRLMLVGRLGDRQSVNDETLIASLEALRREVGFTRRVRLTCAGTISSPVALGRSEICLPALAISDLNAELQRSMLAHELAHLARRDPLWLDASSVIERVFFFQPLNRLARRQIETTAEYLCDDWAMRRTGSGLHLAQCLAKVAEWIQASPLGVPVAGMAEQRSLLVSRISRLLEGSTMNSTTSRRGAAGLALVLLVAMIAIAPRVAGRGAQALNVAHDTGERSSRHAPYPPRAVIAAALPRNYPIAPVAMAREMARGSRSGEPADSAVVNALIGRLKDEDLDVRRAAARSLGRLEDPRAVPPLIESLKDSDARMRAEVIDALSNFEDDRTISPIAALLDDRSQDVRHNALNALERFDHGVPAAPVIRLLNDSSADVRRSAIGLLQHLGEHSASPAIARLIHDSSKDVRVAAIEALGELGDASAAAAMRDALSDADVEVRQVAIQALDNLKVGIPEATLLNLLKDASAEVRQEAAAVAGRRSVLGAIPSLRRMLDDPKAEVRESAVEALGNMSDVAARDALRAALTSKDPKVRRAAAEALGDRQ